MSFLYSSTNVKAENTKCRFYRRTQWLGNEVKNKSVKVSIYIAFEFLLSQCFIIWYFIKWHRMSVISRTRKNDCNRDIFQSSQGGGLIKYFLCRPLYFLHSMQIINSQCGHFLRIFSDASTIDWSINSGVGPNEQLELSHGSFAASQAVSNLSLS